MGYGFSLELQIIVTAFAEVHRVVMIDSSPPILQDDISALHFHVGETNALAAQKTCPLLEISLSKITYI